MSSETRPADGRGAAPAAERARWTWLAILRFVLSVVVVVFHYDQKTGATGWWRQLDGRVAVLAFLIISGYSMAASLARGTQGFYRRRLLRVYPHLITSVLLTQILTSLSAAPVAHGGWGVALATIVFTPGLVCMVPTLNIPLWFMGVELVFYVLAPFLPGRSTRTICALAFLSIAAYWSPLVKNWLYGAPPLCYLWPCLLGFLLGARYSRALAAVAFATAGLISFHPVVTYAPWAVLMYVASVFLLVAGRLPVPGERWERAFNYLGALSFPLYLVHYPIMMFTMDTVKIWNFSAVLGIVTFATLVFHHVVDQPSHRAIAWLADRVSPAAPRQG